METKGAGMPLDTDFIQTIKISGDYFLFLFFWWWLKS
jgi:hypothetical protein